LIQINCNWIREGLLYSYIWDKIISCEVFTTVTVHTGVSWVVIPCSTAGRYQHFGRTCYHHLQIEVRRVRVLLGYTDRLQRRWSIVTSIHAVRREDRTQSRPVGMENNAHDALCLDLSIYPNHNLTIFTTY
jgi:hypothetical protein